MKDLHEKTKIIKPLDKTIEYHLELGVGKDLVVKTQKVVIIKEKNKRSFIALKTSHLKMPLGK